MDTRISASQVRPPIDSSSYGVKKSMSAKFQNVVNVLSKSGMSFRQEVDPKVLVENFKTEIDLTEKELSQSKQIENKLIDLIHQVY